MNLEANRNNTRKYPPVEIGSLVQLFRKRKRIEKQSQALWSEQRYEVKKIEDVPGVGKLYHLEGHKQPVLRAEILIKGQINIDILREVWKHVGNLCFH